MPSFNKIILPVAVRLDSRLDKTGGDDACWPFIGCRNEQGYGKIRINGRSMRAHRVAWELSYGKLESDLFVCHKCDNPPCCNPSHLFIGTPQDNASDMVKKGRHLINPKHLPFGDAHWSRRYPEKVKRGMAHPLKKNPLLAAHGESAGLTKMTNESVIESRREFELGVATISHLAKKHRITYTAMYNIIHRKTWRYI